MTDQQTLRQTILERLRLTPVPGVPEIVLYTAHPASQLSSLIDQQAGVPPYWAYTWAGGLALVRYLLDHPTSVKDLRALDLGAGGGLVGIVAAKAGASSVLASEVDPNGWVALALNAEANDVRVDLWEGGMDEGPLPPVDVILAGDVFYDRAVATDMVAFLSRCVAAGITVLVGDPGRKDLPLSRLQKLAEYPVADFGDGSASAEKQSAVYSFVAK